MTARKLHSSVPLPPRSSGVFLRRCSPWRYDDPPDPVELADDARALTLPSTAAVWVVPCAGEPGRAAVVTDRTVSTDLELEVRCWLARVDEPGILHVPEELVELLECRQAAVVPIRSAVWHAGAVAVPAGVELESTMRRIDALCADFVLRLESADRKALQDALRTRERLPSRRPLLQLVD